MWERDFTLDFDEVPSQYYGNGSNTMNKNSNNRNNNSNNNNNHNNNNIVNGNHGNSFSNASTMGSIESTSNIIVRIPENPELAKKQFSFS